MCQNKKTAETADNHSEKMKFRNHLKSVINLKKLIVVCIAICASFSLQAQVDNLKHSVLFTLGQYEQIFYNEYFVAQHFNQNRFACIIEDTLKKTQTFVFNGKRIVTSTNGLWVEYLNVKEENGYVLHSDNGLNIKGVVYKDLRYWIFDGDNYEKIGYRRQRISSI